VGTPNSIAAFVSEMHELTDLQLGFVLELLTVEAGRRIRRKEARKSGKLKRTSRTPKTEKSTPNGKILAPRQLQNAPPVGIETERLAD